MKDRSTDERRYYYRVLRHLLSEKVKASYKEEEVRPLPSRMVDLLKALEQRLVGHTVDSVGEASAANEKAYLSFGGGSS